jgi:hypothetical protein
MYLVERYVPSVAVLPAFEDGAVEGRPTEGGRVRHVLSALIPADEICLSLFEAPSEEALAEALATRGLPFVRIVEAQVQGGLEPGAAALLKPAAVAGQEGPPA